MGESIVEHQIRMNLICTIPTPPGSTIITIGDLRDLIKEINMKTLTCINWYINDAVYLNNKLIYFGPSIRDYSLLKVLGYELNRLDSISDIVPSEYEIESNKWWKPPKTLQELLEIQKAIKEREKLEKIEYHKKALRDL